jgi:hypothetical protein
MQNTVNLGFFAVHKIVSKYAGKNLCVHGEDAKRHKTEEISVKNGSTLIFLDPYFLCKIGWIKPKNHIKSQSL